MGLCACGCTRDQMETPRAVKGSLNLQHWNFRADGGIDLDGDWKFYWHELILPEKSNDRLSDDTIHYFPLPNTWNHYKLNGKPLGGSGYATFILDVLMPETHEPLSIEIREIFTSYRLWIIGLSTGSSAGSSAGSRGIVGTEKDTSAAEFKPNIIPVPRDTGNVRLVLQVSNFHHRRGGPWMSIRLDRTEVIQASASFRQFQNIFLVGSILMIGFYHLSMFLLGEKYGSSLYFGIFCCLIALRSMVMNERYLHVLFPGLSWTTLMRIEYITFYLSIPVFALFIITVFPKDFSKKICNLLLAAGLLFSATVCATPVPVFSHTVQVFQFITFMTSIYLFFALFKAYRQKREGAYVILAGFFIFFLTIVNDILYLNEVINTSSLVPIGLFLFIFSQAFLLSLIYSKTFKEVEIQKTELGTTNQTLEKEIQIRKTLQANLIQSHEKFEKSRQALILGLAKLAEYRDEDTGAHLKRIREFCILIAVGLSKLPKYEKYITQDYIDNIYQSSILHDIGKVGIKDEILLKPGKLTGDEFNIIKTHTTIGGNALTAIESEFKSKSFLTLGKNIAYHHHEKWDGSGYPEGLKNDGIPLSARIVAVADVYDALTSKRSYKKAFSHTEAVQIITEGRAKHFDPDVVDQFERLSEEFRLTRMRFPD